jgi:hypothetical protein
LNVKKLFYISGIIIFIIAIIIVYTREDKNISKIDKPKSTVKKTINTKTPTTKNENIEDEKYNIIDEDGFNIFSQIKDSEGHSNIGKDITIEGDGCNLVFKVTNEKVAIDTSFTIEIKESENVEKIELMAHSQHYEEIYLFQSKQGNNIDCSFNALNLDKVFIRVMPLSKKNITEIQNKTKNIENFNCGYIKFDIKFSESSSNEQKKDDVNEEMQQTIQRLKRNYVVAYNKNTLELVPDLNKEGQKVIQENNKKNQMDLKSLKLDKYDYDSSNLKIVFYTTEIIGIKKPNEKNFTYKTKKYKYTTYCVEDYEINAIDEIK